MGSQHLPCDGDGVCMLCKKKPSECEKLVCKTCVTPWHVDCLNFRPESMASALQWECPDCSEPLAAAGNNVGSVVSGAGGKLMAAVRAIEADVSLSESEKAKRRQKLLSGNSGGSDDDEKEKEEKAKDDNEILAILGENMKCSFCMQLPNRPVTTPCGHNFCLKCFEKWVAQGKKTCAKCRDIIPDDMASQPRINSSLVFAIRMARMPKATSIKAPRVFERERNEDLPDEAFTTERAKKAGKANAKSGRIFVTIPKDHFGPITPEYDPLRKMGVLVGDCWEDRYTCRQWGVHFPHVSGIAGQAKHGAQSVVLSGGYEDDEDYGDWFLYTGSGGRDLKGNKRTNKKQSFPQTFKLYNEALRLSCRKGYPVRVIRSHKDTHSNFAPETGVRYDGIYRIEKCWRMEGKQDKILCRYLFIRCDNSPAPWTSDEHGDRPRPLPNVPELKKAFDLTERTEIPHWDFDVDEGCWKWKKPQPPSKKDKEKGMGISRSRKDSNAKILKELSCLICRKVLTLPITTPCAHNFCKSCLDGAFEGQKFVRERSTGGRQLRTQKNIMKCPSCTMDISEFLQNAQVNRELMGAIESLIHKFEENGSAEGSSGTLNENEETASEVSSEITMAISDETENKPVMKTDISMANAEGVNSDEPCGGTKRGRKRKNIAMVKAQKAQKVTDDGNDSPTSPLHVGSNNELE